MATATLTYSNLQQHEQTWSAETTGLLSPKSPEPTSKWGQTDNSNASFPQNNEPNVIQSKANVSNNVDNQDNSDSDEIIYNQDEKNREIRECLKNIQTSDDPDKAYWNYFKTVLEQEGHEKAQAAYLEYIKNERLLACIQAYKAQAEAKYQWNEKQRIKEEQLNHYKHLMNLDEAAHNRTNQQTMSEIDYFKSKWESYALPMNGTISPDIYSKDDLIAKNQENLLTKNGNYIQYNNLTPDIQQVGHPHAVQDIVDVDATNYYLNAGIQDQKPTAQYIAQHLAQKMVQPAMKRIIGNKGDSNALDDIMADFQANGRDSTAPPSPRASRAWGAATTAAAATPIAVRPTLRQMIFPNASTAGCFGNIAPNVTSPAVVNSLASSLPRTEAELIRQLNSLIGATSAQLQKQQQQLYPSQAQYGIQLDSQFRRRRTTVTSTECAFCRNNGEQPAVYRGHILKDAEGRVRCPILRDYTCRNCGATGDAAHTVKYCPLTPKTDLSFTQLQKNLRMANGKRRGSQETTQWTTCDIP